VNIIYVEDDATSRTVMRDMLAAAGVTLAEAADVRTGLRMIRTGTFDMVLMDLRMPDINGLTAIRQLRAMAGAERDLPVVVVSAELSDGVREMCRSAGANACLQKPLTMDALFRAMGTIMASNSGFVLN